MFILLAYEHTRDMDILVRLSFTYVYDSDQMSLGFQCSNTSSWSTQNEGERDRCRRLCTCSYGP